MYRLMLDTADLDVIAAALKTLPVTGVTTNPTILLREGKIDVYSHLRAISELCGKHRCLHVQVMSADTETMIKEAHRIVERLGSQNVYIKIPVTEQGITAIKQLSAQGFKITATAVFSAYQGMMASLAGAEYIAVYFNRLQKQGGHPDEVIHELRGFIDSTGSSAKILAASFKTPAQVVQVFACGAHSATVDPAILIEGFGSAITEQAVASFGRDTVALCGEGKTMLDV